MLKWLNEVSKQKLAYLTQLEWVHLGLKLMNEAKLSLLQT